MPKITFCWLPPGQRAGQLLGRAGLDAKEVDHLLDQRRFLLPAEQAVFGKALDDRQRQVLAHALGQKQALPAPILRHQRDAVAAGQRLARIVDRSRLAPEFDAAARLGGAEQRLEQLALAVALQAADAEHLAFAQCEIGAAEPAAARKIR